MDPKKIVTAALFMSPNPLSTRQLMNLVNTTEYDKGLKIIKKAQKQFNEANDALEIIKTEENKYRMAPKRELTKKVSSLASEKDFSKAVLRTLALIAFKQPIKQSKVAKIRGNKSYKHIDELVERSFVKKTKQKRTYVLETTRKFTRYFGEEAKKKKLTPKTMQTKLQEKK